MILSLINPQLANEKCHSLDGRKLGQKHKRKYVNTDDILNFSIPVLVPKLQVYTVKCQTTYHQDSYVGNLKSIGSHHPSLLCPSSVFINHLPTSLSSKSKNVLLSVILSLVCNQVLIDPFLSFTGVLYPEGWFDSANRRYWQKLENRRRVRRVLILQAHSLQGHRSWSIPLPQLLLSGPCPNICSLLVL